MDAQMLDLNELKQGMLAITPAYGETLAEAAGVCLESQGHIQGVELRVIGYASNLYSLYWPTITDQTRRTWNDLQEATELGAMAIAVLLSGKEIGYSAIQRSVKGTGIDYWLGDGDDPHFQNKARLEISGILKASGDNVERAVKARVNQKLRQAERSAGSLPVYVIVVEFGSPLAEVQKR